MTKPPTTGTHARHRPLDAPGPLGWNDHGDPFHWRRQGRSPGPLSVNDHGTPLGARPLLLPSEQDERAVRQINETVSTVNSTANGDIATRLHACLVAVGTRQDTDARDATSRWVRAYFYARLLAFEGKTSILLETGGPEGPVTDLLTIGAVEYRTMGAFFQPLGVPGEGAGEATTGLSYQRAGQRPPTSRYAAAADRSVYWIEEGRADGLRDRSAGGDGLRTYLPHAVLS
jgi:hypothetical protein